MPVRRHGATWEARVQHSGRRVSRTFGNRRDAFEWERRYRHQLEDRRVGRTPAYGLEEALERWLTGEASGLKSHADLIKKVRTIYPYAKGRALVEVVDVAEALKADAIATKAAPATVNRKLAILRRVARLAFRQWSWLAEPLGDRITLLPGERQRHVFLAPAQVQRILKHARGPVRDAILLAALTGLRRGEILALRPEDRRDGALVLLDTKNGRPRIVPLPPEAVAIRLPIRMDKDTLTRGFQAAAKRAGIKGVRLHDLRHTYASWLIQSGSSLTAVRDLLGHSSLAVTSRYSHLSQEHLRAAVAGLPRLAGTAGMVRGQGRKKKAA